MTPAVALPERRVILENISWGTYERLLAENHSPATRFAYDEGVLEIMVVSIRHESPNRALAILVETVAEETGRDLLPFGSATIKREDLSKGVEPDSWFYFDERAAAMRDRDELEPATDPHPDLAIEVDITRSSLDRFPIFSALGIAEVWRYDGERVFFYKLAGREYVEIDTSGALPPITSRQAQLFVAESRKMHWVEWVRSIREWVQANRY